MEEYLNKFYNFIDKIGKHNFILIIFVFVVLLVTGLYQTFSLYTESEGLSIVNGIDTYSFILNASNETNSVTIAAGNSKNFDITIRNDSTMDLKYGLYSSTQSNTDDNIFIGYSTVTKHLPNGIISANTDYTVTIKVYNYSNENITIDFGVLYGFENEELTLRSEQYWIEPLTLMKNLFKTYDGDYNYYRADEYRNYIVNAYFVDLDAIDANKGIENAIVSWNISANGSNDDSVVAWLVLSSKITEVDDPNTYYDLYIGSREKIYTESLYAMFSQMSELESVSFGNLDTSLTTDMAFFFRECSSLTSLDLSYLDSSNITNMWSMFGGCTKLINLTLIDPDTNTTKFNTSKVTDMRSMFLNCSSLSSLDVSGFITSNVTAMTQMFQGCSGLTSLTLTNFDTSNVTSMINMFQGCSGLTSLTLTNFDTSKVISMEGMFSTCSSLTNLDLSGWDNSNVTTMLQMFYQCSNLTNLDLSDFKSPNVTNMQYMFYNCSSLTNLNVSSFNTSNVTNMFGMFNRCSKLTSLDLSGFDTSNVTTMRTMFYSCSSLTSLDVSSFDTSKVTSMYSMFNGCRNLTSLDLSGFNTSNVTETYGMFYNCSKLSTTIIIRNSNVTNYSSMFTAAATEDGTQILVYYNSNTQTLVNNMVATKSDTSHVYAAIALAEMSVGSYVRYVGIGVDGNQCDNTTTVNGWTSCSGKNANYASDTSMGYCTSTEHPFDVNGWRIAYIEDGNAHLISAGSTDCLCTNSDDTTSNSSCSTYLDADNLYKHFDAADNIALKYCNANYAKGGVCDNTTAWAMDALDFERITATPLNATSCYNSSSNTTCGYNNSLIDNGGYYWYMTATTQTGKTHGAFIWQPTSRYVAIYNSSAANGVRPVLALDSSVVVVGGTGTYTDPYIITK